MPDAAMEDVERMTISNPVVWYLGISAQYRTNRTVPTLTLAQTLATDGYEILIL